MAEEPEFIIEPEIDDSVVRQVLDPNVTYSRWLECAECIAGGFNFCWKIKGDADNKILTKA